MSRRSVPSVAADFASVVEFLRGRGIIPTTAAPSLFANAKRIHRATYSLILWRFRLRRLPKHGTIFVEEIASDALQVLPQALMGYSKAARMLTRGIVENTLRHIYFSDHPIEFERMNRERKWYIGNDALLEYAKLHPIFRETERHFDAIARLSSLYEDLSASVHGRTVRDLEMRVALRKIAYSDDSCEKDVALVERCAAAANFCLAMFHRERMGTFTAEDRRVILQTMPSGARSIWTESQ